MRALDYGSLRAECAEILREWTADPKMATMLSIRGTLTQLFPNGHFKGGRIAKDGDGLPRVVIAVRT